ncbi:HIT-like domain-containing protein [Suillus lakei]|nr:HIT-like domain-containing protein [Suillus lakei]
MATAPSAPNLAIFRRYASKPNPTTLPPSILLSHSETCLTVFDAFPKSIFHLLVIPRIKPPLSVRHLADLRSLLRCEKSIAKGMLMNLNEEANNVKKMIEEEMMKRYKFKWEIWMGFHPISSMEHLHLHVLSADLYSPKMKLKKHYNSFHPSLGFFLHMKDVLSWFDAEPSYYQRMIKLDASQYEPLLKDSDLCCWRCDRALESMPRLKAHLHDEFDKLTKREKAKLERKRKRSDVPASSVQVSVTDDERPEKVARLMPSQDDGSNDPTVGGDLRS